MLAALALLSVRPAGAVTQGSVHDFSADSGPNSKTIGTQGSCSSCHLPHNAVDTRLWPRSLGQERSTFGQTTNPDYLPSPTLLCFDCHDDNATTAGPAVDNDPLKSSWTTKYEPQDIAFGYTITNVPSTPPSIVPGDLWTQGDNGPTAIIGYYELIKGDVPGGSQSMPAAGNPTGGHYWKSPSPTGGPSQGDKISCRLCHDPHRRTSNEAFVVETAVFANGDTVTIGSGRKASNKDELTNPNRSRYGTGTVNASDNSNGRAMCAACHHYADSPGGPVSAGGVSIPKPPTTLTQHLDGNPTPCTKCHSHNKLWTSCNECHGFPPMRTIAEAGGTFDMTARPDAESYSGGAGAHRRHKDALGTAIFKCEICHGPNAGSADWHNQGTGVVSATNVNIMGQGIYWSPAGYPGAITPNYPNGAAGPATGDAAWVFTRMGVNNATTKRCSGVACHGNPLVGDPVALYWTDDMIDLDEPESVPPVMNAKIQICKWCHDATPATIDGGVTYAPNAMGNNTTFGAEVNGHGVGLAGAVKAGYDKDAVNDGLGAAGANKECTVCHDTRYVADPIPADLNRTKSNRMHFGAGTDPRDEKRLWDTINGAPIGTAAVFPTGPDQACSACHQNGVNTVADGLDQSHHGIPPQPPPAGGYIPSEGDTAFTRACRQCHNVHGANFNGAGRNLFMVGKWLDVNNDKTPNAGDGAYVDSNAATALANITSADNPVVFTATTGADSFDENDGAYDTTGSADRDDVCASCHPAGTGGGTGSAGGSHNGLALPIGDMRGQNCMTCHDHDYDNSATTIDAFMPSGCNGCHGRATADSTIIVSGETQPVYNGQYWPDGTPPVTASMQYADDNAGAHYRHVQALAMQLYALNAEQVVADSDTYTKQKTICAFCHNDPGGVDPGGGPHTQNVGNDNQVTVYQDSDDATADTDVFWKLTVGAGVLAKAKDTDDINGNQKYDFGTNVKNCSNLVCHNQAATTPTGAANNWDAPPNWTTANCATNCHTVATYTIAHSRHVTTKGYACTQCHVDNSANLAHGNGEVDMQWNNDPSLEGVHRNGTAVVTDGNGYYDKNDNGVKDAAPGDTGFAYKSGGSGVANATNIAYSVACYQIYCHGGDNAAWGGSRTSPSPDWNDFATMATRLACTTCHATAPSTGRHAKHVANTAWVPNNCSSCHLSSAVTAGLMDGYPTHVNGSVTMGGQVQVVPPYDPLTGVCTNSCHLVGVAVPPVSANPGDWLDAPNLLACTDCHTSGYISTEPATGLHRATTAMAHDAQFRATANAPTETATCTHCHRSTGVTGIGTVGQEPSDSHIDGPTNAATPQNSTVVNYNFNNTYIPPSGYDNSGYAASTSCQAYCHTDYRVSADTGSLDTGALWKRRWMGVTDAKPLSTNNPGDAVCSNCHGDFTNGWNFVVVDANTSTTPHTDPYAGNTGDKMNMHSACQTCHGWGYNSTVYSQTWAGNLPAALPAHGDGSITMNGPDDPPGPAAGAEYDDATGGCTAACHAASFVLDTNSGWPANYGDFGSGACEQCHNGTPATRALYPLAPNVMGNGTSLTGTRTVPKPFDDGTYGYNVNGHGRNYASASTGDAIDRLCIACHDTTVPTGTHLDGTLDRAGTAGNANPFHLVSGFIGAASNEYNAQITFDNYCWTACHNGPTTDMRHATDTDNVHATANVMEFGQYKSYAAPTSVPPMYVDRNITWLGAYDGPPNHGLCVSCHDPHGSTAGSALNSGNNKMMHIWGKKIGVLCNRCHN